MITAVVSTATRIPFTVLDALGAPVIGLAGSVTAIAYLLSNTATTLTPTVAEIGSTGSYILTFTPTATGDWYVLWSAPVDGDTARYEETVEVRTAAQADPMAAVVSGYTDSNTIGGRIKMITAGSRS